MCAASMVCLHVVFLGGLYLIVPLLHLQLLLLVLLLLLLLLLHLQAINDAPAYLHWFNGLHVVAKPYPNA
jgi:hypothetical protein